jgi:hypothetical protein
VPTNIETEEAATAANEDSSSMNLRLGYSYLPTVPELEGLREHLLFMNFAGVQRGLAALVDEENDVLSVLPLGVVGAEEPGNATTKHSDAKPIILPDGERALVIIHALPAETWGQKGRCLKKPRVFLSIVALRGVHRLDAPIPSVLAGRPYPYLDEIFQTLLEDCDASAMNRWEFSADHKTIKVYNSIYPTQPAATYIYKGQRYQAMSGQ